VCHRMRTTAFICLCVWFLTPVYRFVVTLRKSFTHSPHGGVPRLHDLLQTCGRRFPIYVCTHAKLAIHYMKQGIIIAKSGQDVIMGIELS
jgi:hypothetical protein